MVIVDSLESHKLDKSVFRRSTRDAEVHPEMWSRAPQTRGTMTLQRLMETFFLWVHSHITCDSFSLPSARWCLSWELSHCLLLDVSVELVPS